MKVLQTLGGYQGGQAGIFQYKRDSKGIVIDPTVGMNANAEVIEISNEDWSEMIERLENIGKKVVDLTEMKQEIAEQLGMNNTETAAVVAILEHEGTFDHYGGFIGGGDSVSIHLRRDDD
ncbi:hypothetical protein NFJ59_07475 [Citrobacter freundii]|uniref:hypothetical protein n=1 Tax=Citrobacter freundii TaxID=546 RepID=UPI0015E90A16|nr:hypothetical protein [Citrobacter freundii]MBA8033293.1 hypothetical protein [Citrobacter freundii]QMD26071.1 hypothetical protein HVZ46_16555 [Citrobacter freundii]WFW14563.1 hypothetical protein NFJ59_07475 [Citrobacter freundii]